MFRNEQSQMIQETREAKFLPHGALQIFIFIALFFAANIVQAIVMLFFGIVDLLINGGEIIRTTEQIISILESLGEIFTLPLPLYQPENCHLFL